MSVKAERLTFSTAGDFVAPLAAALAATGAGPDLRAHSVITPGAASLTRILPALHRALNAPAILPPFIGPLERFLAPYWPSQPVLSAAQRELLLFDALRQYPQLYSHGSPWPLATELLALFDELSLSGASTYETTAFAANMATRDTPERIRALNMEAHLLADLFRAWQDLLAEKGVLDSAAALRLALTKAQTTMPVSGHLFFVASTVPPLAIREWVEALHRQGRLTTIVAEGLAWEFSVPAASTGAFGALLESAIAQNQPPLRARAEAFAQQHPASPARERLALWTALDEEDEARGIELQLRRWWLAGKRQLGLATEDRRLARRIRALLERADLPVDDRSGWPLSTTSAASLIDRWLEALAGDFSLDILLELLRAPLCFSTLSLAARREAATALEYVLVDRRLEPPRGVEAWRTLVADGAGALAARAPDAAATLLAALDRLNAARRQWPARIDAAHETAARFAGRLARSLRLLDAEAAYAQDAAGQILLDEVSAAGADHGGPALSFDDWRTHWSKRLERVYFRPPGGEGVAFLSLQAARFERFEGLIVAAATANTLPGAGRVDSFLNDRARMDLNLPSRAQQVAQRRADFFAALHAADTVLVTRRLRDGAVATLESPWLARLQAFHRCAYGDALEEGQLSPLLAAGASPLRLSSGALPAAQTAPQGRALRALKPAALSATAYQTLLDCPYQFFVRYVLRLRALDSDPAESAILGERAHAILQRFHSENRVGASHARDVDRLLNLLEAALAADLQRNTWRHGWRTRLRAALTHYAQWQAERARQYAVEATELALERETAGWVLRGRIDRVDRGTDGVALVDYKTGQLPAKKELAAGEHGQLGFYRLLYGDEAHAAVLLALHEDGIAPLALDRDALAASGEQVRVRLQTLAAAFEREEPLPAHGQAQVCARCEAYGVCRRGFWTR